MAQNEQGQTIIVTDFVCWLCGKPFGRNEYSVTTHHCLPKNLNPVKNITIPLHEKCHGIVTAEDTASLTSFAMKLNMQARTLTVGTDNLLKYLNKSIKAAEGDDIMQKCTECGGKPKLIQKGNAMIPIIQHKKDCGYLKSLMENSVEV